jgi:hypothetical protein
MVQHNSGDLADGGDGHDPDEGPLWDLMVMDEVSVSVWEADEVKDAAIQRRRGGGRGGAGWGHRQAPGLCPHGRHPAPVCSLLLHHA